MLFGHLPQIWATLEEKYLSQKEKNSFIQEQPHMRGKYFQDRLTFLKNEPYNLLQPSLCCHTTIYVTRNHHPVQSLDQLLYSVLQWSFADSVTVPL